MGKQSSRIYYRGKDHKDIYFQGNFHEKMYIGSNLVWEKLYPEEYFVVNNLSTFVNHILLSKNEKKIYTRNNYGIGLQKIQSYGGAYMVAKGWVEDEVENGNPVSWKCYMTYSVDGIKWYLYNNKTLERYGNVCDVRYALSRAIVAFDYNGYGNMRDGVITAVSISDKIQTYHGFSLLEETIDVIGDYPNDYVYDGMAYGGGNTRFGIEYENHYGYTKVFEGYDKHVLVQDLGVGRIVCAGNSTYKINNCVEKLSSKYEFEYVSGFELNTESVNEADACIYADESTVDVLTHDYNDNLYIVEFTGKTVQVKRKIDSNYIFEFSIINKNEKIKVTPYELRYMVSEYGETEPVFSTSMAYYNCTSGAFSYVYVKNGKIDINKENGVCLSFKKDEKFYVAYFSDVYLNESENNFAYEVDVSPHIYIPIPIFKRREN